MLDNLFNQLPKLKIKLRQFLIYKIMKMKYLYIISILTATLFQACSYKHKWQHRLEETEKTKKLSHLQRHYFSQWFDLDTSTSYRKEQIKNYKLWNLSGNVAMDSAGNLQADNVYLMDWHIQDQYTKSQNHLYKQYIQEQEIDSLGQDFRTYKQKSIFKKKWKFETHWLLVLILGVGLVFIWFKKRRSM